ncbi:MAG TPA: bifunctional precorrin-2 dehydrogenase/sirohydrochlorin ferrochelatase [Actinomycetota bacterium]|nr:bifunctional precorrin-2 dehydrogenase/sirohydrochlorin ferrochelatase [Actinomycetota bacterium]
MSRFGYPISLDVTGQVAVVIGEDAVAMGKVEALVAAGARVRVIAEGPGSRLDRLQSDPNVTVERRAYRSHDVDGAVVVVASSAEATLRARIYQDATAAGSLVNVMDDVDHCDFAAPAVVRRGELTIAIGTGGGSPALARRLREDLERQFGEEWGEVLEVLRRVRSETLADLPDIAERSSRWAKALDPEELTRLVKAGRSQEARRRLADRLLAREGAA